MTYLNLYSNSFGWQLFPFYFHLKLNKNANIADFESFEKTRVLEAFTPTRYKTGKIHRIEHTPYEDSLGFATKSNINKFFFASNIADGNCVSDTVIFLGVWNEFRFARSSGST